MQRTFPVVAPKRVYWFLCESCAGPHHFPARVGALFQGVCPLLPSWKPQVLQWVCSLQAQRPSCPTGWRGSWHTLNQIISPWAPNFNINCKSNWNSENLQSTKAQQSKKVGFSNSIHGTQKPHSPTLALDPKFFSKGVIWPLVQEAESLQQSDYLLNSTTCSLLQDSGTAVLEVVFRCFTQI